MERETYQIQLSEENAQEAYREVLRTFPFRDSRVSITFHSQGIPRALPGDLEAIERHVLACEEKNVAPFVEMQLFESMHIPGYFNIATIDANPHIKYAKSEFAQKLHDVAARALISGARPHEIKYSFGSPKAYAQLMEMLDKNHADDKIETMSLGGLVNKYFLQDRLELDMRRPFADNSEKETFDSWIETLRAYEKV